MSLASPKSILITGGSSGIGEALALKYAAPGVFLVLTGRNQNRLEQAAGLCRDRGADVMAASVSVTDRAAMAALVAEADARHALDLVIANAGISGGTGGLGKGEEPEQVRRLFDVNVTGVLNTVEPALEVMKARGCGQVALMSSLASWRGWPGAPAYSASKAAVRVYGEGLRGAMGPTGVRISVIMPGFVESRMTAVNDYPMPFLMGSARAAEIIAAGLARDRGRIAFPWQTASLAWLVGALPDSLATLLLKNMPAKPEIRKI